MTHELDVVRARSPRATPLPSQRLRIAERHAPRARGAMALLPRLGRGPSHAAMRILETTWRLWREPSIGA
ncbi:MAG: hypothetical protein AB7P21_13120 [Lautropia sp.]